MIKKLLNKKMKFLKNQQGLTLIELLVVIVILGIIAAIAIPAVMGNRTDAAKSTNEQNASILQDAVNRYKAVNGSDPTDPIDSDKTKNDLLKEANGGPYIESVPTVEEFTDCDGAFTVTAGKVKLDKACLPDNSPFAVTP